MDHDQETATLLRLIHDAWGWTGLVPIRLHLENDFGNLIVEDASGEYWRIIPEELKCSVVGADAQSLALLEISEEFSTDWQMKPLVALAKDEYGALAEGKKYCLKLPGVLGGRYILENIATISFVELIGFSGDLAKQIRDMPDGTKVELKVIG